MRPLDKARIGYAGYSPDLSAPGDRRRFVAYAKARGLSFESARLDGDYDLVLLTHNGDIPGWTARKRREGDRLTLVFELIDSYLTASSLPRRLAKGTLRRALRIDSGASLDFRATLVEACKTADAVICSTEEQAASIRRYCPDVFVSFDDFSGEIGDLKKDFASGAKLRLVWEGQSTTLRNIQSIREPLNTLKDSIELHVVTDPVVRRYLGRFGSRSAADMLRGIECDIIFHHWERSSFAHDVVGNDLAIIPIDLADDFQRGKPENKLVMLWKMGMPVLTSPTPAYCRAMRGAGLELVCDGSAAWVKKVAAFASLTPERRAAVAGQGRRFAERRYSAAEFLACFDRCFSAAGFSV